MRATILLTAVLFASVSCAGASESPQVETSTAESSAAEPPEQVLVVGEQPGPRLWKVTDGDHVLWIMGVLGPLPQKMIWRSHEVERALGESQQMISGMRVDTDIGFFTRLTLLPSMANVRKNPDKKKLQDVVPPELYQRWLRLKQQYLGKKNDVESWRPIFAGYELYTAAIEKRGMTMKAPWMEQLKKLAKQHDVEQLTPTLELDVDKPRAALKEFKKSPLNDLECFSKTLDRLENDLDTMRLRANAWAVGDIEALQQLPYTNVLNSCLDAIFSASSAQERGWQDLPARVATLWVDTAEAALRRNASTFVVMPMEEILKPDGWLAALIARGYTLDAPDY